MRKVLNGDPVVGAVVVRVREMTPREMRREGWEGGRIDGPPSVVELSTGALLYPSRDPEGNGPGALFGRWAGKTFSFGR